MNTGASRVKLETAILVRYANSQRVDPALINPYGTGLH